MTGSWLNDDDEFLTELGAAIHAAQEVPDSFVQAAKYAFAWHELDSELARLTSDTGVDAELSGAELSGAGLRAGRAAVRSLSFASAGLTVDLDVHQDALRGQVVPATSGTLQVRGNDGSVHDVPIDEFGWFVIAPVPAPPFRLSIRLDSGAAALTEWITT